MGSLNIWTGVGDIVGPVAWQARQSPTSFSASLSQATILWNEAAVLFLRYPGDPGELCPVSVSAGLGALRCKCHVRADWSK